MKTLAARTWLVGLTMLVLGGCAPPPAYQVHRAALVSPPTPPMWAGDIRRIGFGLGNSTMVWKNPPERAPESDSGLYVASTQIDGNFHVGIGKHVALWIPMSYGFSPASFAAAPCLQGRPSHGVFSGGLGVAVRGQVSERWFLAGSLEGQLAWVPSRIRAVCVENCEFAEDVVEEEKSDVVGVVRLGMLGGVDLGILRLFAGIGFRNHPTNVRLTREVTYVPEWIDPEVEFGPWYFMAGVGAQVDLGDQVSILAQLYQPFPLLEHDLLYGPVLGIAVDFHDF